MDHLDEAIAELRREIAASAGCPEVEVDLHEAPSRFYRRVEREARARRVSQRNRARKRARGRVRHGGAVVVGSLAAMIIVSVGAGVAIWGIPVLPRLSTSAISFVERDSLEVNTPSINLRIEELQRAADALTAQAGIIGDRAGRIRLHEQAGLLRDSAESISRRR